jgi:signal transduction histidine kinase
MLLRWISGLAAEFRAIRLSLSLKFVIGTAVVLGIVMGASLHLVSLKDRALMMEQLHSQARTLFAQIVLTRKWIADHGGIFVESGPMTKPSPFLQDPEIEDIKGRRYLKESPAMVTKELSRYARRKGLYWFNITSLKLVNPANAPDEFERNALLAFENGKTEAAGIFRQGTFSYYRYMAPLYIEKPCLNCHASQGYREGDVRGGISVSIPMDDILAKYSSEQRTLILVSITTLSVLMVFLFVMMKELVIRPIKRLQSSIEAFTKGDMGRTEIQRTGDELEDLSMSFAEMSKSLNIYHDKLEEKVRNATRDLAEANEKLAALNEKKSDFIAKISHELRTPMTSIKGAMDYITARLSGMLDDSGDEDIKEFLNVVRNNADRITSMVNDTLVLERIESGMFDLERSRTDMVSLIKEIIISLQSVAMEKGVTFEIVSPQEVHAEVDEDRMRQVIVNLLSNAIEFSPEKGRISIAVENRDGFTDIVVEDEGPGIPVEIREKIFDKFYTIGRRKGTGLGLAICRGIVEAHHGTIIAGDGRDGKGSRFHIRIPVVGGKPSEQELEGKDAGKSPCN